MNGKRNTILILSLALGMAGCDRSRDGEIEELHREIAALKAAKAAKAPEVDPPATTPLPSPAATAIPTPTPEERTSDELVRLKAESRRMSAAISSGISFAEFRQRFIEILALLGEAIPTLTNPELPTLKNREVVKSLLDFFVTLDDAYRLWDYKIEKDGLDLRYSHVQGGGWMCWTPDEVGDRWGYELDELIPRYDLHLSDGGDYQRLHVGPALKKVLTYAVKAFEKFEKQ